MDERCGVLLVRYFDISLYLNGVSKYKSCTEKTEINMHYVEIENEVLTKQRKRGIL